MSLHNKKVLGLVPGPVAFPVLENHVIASLYASATVCYRPAVKFLVLTVFFNFNSCRLITSEASTA